VAGQNGQLNSLASAGGIGGLLAVYDTNGTTTGQNPAEDDKTYVYLYDANGNVGQLVDWTDIPDWGTKGLNSGQDWHADRLVARYEYDPYGNVVGPDTGLPGDPYTTTNPFRFSTKQWDDETGLGYWGYRHYSPTLGRWISRDPIGERGGFNLYGYVGNCAVDAIDLFGWVTLGEECYYTGESRINEKKQSRRAFSSFDVEGLLTSRTYCEVQSHCECEVHCKDYDCCEMKPWVITFPNGVSIVAGYYPWPGRVRDPDDDYVEWEQAGTSQVHYASYKDYLTATEKEVETLINALGEAGETTALDVFVDAVGDELVDFVMDGALTEEEFDKTLTARNNAFKATCAATCSGKKGQRK